MQVIDGFFIAVMCVFSILGFKVGVLKRGVAVVFLVLGLVLATRSMHGLGGFLTGWWNVHEVVGAVLAFVLVLFGTVIVAILVVEIISRHSKRPRLWSRLTGASIGLVESTMYLSLLLFVLNIYALPSRETRSRSFLYAPIRAVAPFVFDKTNALFSGSTSFDEELKKSFEKFKFEPSE
jgi:hypothetical protein